MNTVYANNSISVKKDLFLGWVILTVDDDNVPAWLPFDSMDKAVLSEVVDELTKPVFPAEAREAAKKALQEKQSEPEPELKEFPIKVVNSQENWRLIEGCSANWLVEEETTETMLAVFFSQADLDKVKEALKRSSAAYPV